MIGRQVHLTGLGKEIAKVCEDTINEAAKIKQKASEQRGELAGVLKISIVSPAKYVIPYLLSDFLKTNGSVELIMDVTNKSQVLTNLERNEIDFAMLSTLPKNIQIEKIELMRNKLFLVGSTKSPTIKKLDSKVGHNPAFIYREQGSATRQTMENYLKSKNLSGEKRIQLTSNEAVKQAVIAGLGYSIMPLIGIKNAIYNHDLQIIPLPGLPVVTNWHLIWLKNKQFGNTQLAFLEYIKEQKDKTIADRFAWLEEYGG